MLCFSTETGELNKFLKAATGVDKIPPGGFDPKIKVTFAKQKETIAEEVEVADSPIFFNTCLMEVTLPVLEYWQFKDSLKVAITFDSTFTDY